MCGGFVWATRAQIIWQTYGYVLRINYLEIAHQTITCYLAMRGGYVTDQWLTTVARQNVLDKNGNVWSKVFSKWTISD